MISFSPDSIEDTYLRPCYCTSYDEYGAGGGAEKNYIYAEGTERDKGLADSSEEICENVWYESKPPRLFGKEVKPYVTARQVYITRIMLEGSRATDIKDEEDEKEQIAKAVVGVNKKKNAVRVLSQGNVELG
ncbi:unnamed protein product [Acanthoscelides obtectus]|uniref:Uncharacterized protein n=1 Tax=Acanthoscelides obtectus TaxID=200917 RepID=A0A9P0MBB7_ACAOB|nr:unnamed protein product [Acanthoscelides obtectus]CAK1645211.1 hypothetical protein AOBTE_LOCUS14059 [Acanthoscelides obtectus]